MASPYALDFNPLLQPIQNNQQLALQRNRLAQDEERLGFERDLQPLRVQTAKQSLDSARAAEGRAAALHPLQLSQTQQAIDFARAGEGRAAAMHGPQLAQANQQVEAGAAAAAKTKMGLYGGFVERFTDPKSPGYEPDAEKRTVNWGKTVDSILSDIPYLKDPHMGPLIRDPNIGPQMIMRMIQGDPLARKKLETDIKKDEAQAELYAAQAKAAGNKTTGYDNLNQYANTAEGMRKEFQALPNVKGYEQARGAADRLERLVTSSKDGKFGTGAGDIAMVFNFMKTLDPESIVMPGEAATARNAPGLSDQMRNWYNLLISGQFLTPETRKDFLNVVNSELDSRKGIAINEARRYRGLARGVQVNPEHVVPRQFAGIDLDGDGRPDRPAPSSLGQPQSIRVPSQSGQPVDIPAAAIRFLIQNGPSAAAAFEQKYGVSARQFLEQQVD